MSCTSPSSPIVTPTPNAKVINQIPIQKNGCGPASLINAYRSASPKWSKATEKIIGNTDKEQFDFMVKYYGKIFSRPKLKHTTHFINAQSGYELLLEDTHKHLKKSLKAGFPAILSLKRFAQRGSRWRQVHGHFVTLYQIPSSIPYGAKSFEIKYIDPWGGSIKTGSIKIPEKTFYAVDNSAKKLTFRKSPTLVVDFPESNLGKHLLKSNERSATILAASITP